MLKSCLHSWSIASRVAIIPASSTTELQKSRCFGDLESAVSTSFISSYLSRASSLRLIPAQFCLSTHALTVESEYAETRRVYNSHIPKLAPSTPNATQRLYIEITLPSENPDASDPGALPFEGELETTFYTPPGIGLHINSWTQRSDEGQPSLSSRSTKLIIGQI